jgi:hypothetical protein
VGAINIITLYKRLDSMDTWTPAELEAHVKAKIELIKTRMPETYKLIGARAAAVDAKAHAMVKRALRGEANLFYAIEAGHVVGTPFEHGYAGKPLQDQVAGLMVNFGCSHVCIWGLVYKEVQRGAH